MFVEGEAVFARDACEHGRRLLGRSRRNVLAALRDEAVGEVVVDGAAGAQVFDGAEAQARRLDGDGRGRDPAGALVEEAARVGVGEDVGADAGAFELEEDGVAAEDVAHRLVGEALLVVAERGRRVTPVGWRLPRRALRPARRRGRVRAHQHAGVGGVGSSP